MEYVTVGRLDAANRIFKQHTVRFPTNARAFGNLAACLYRQGELQSAASAYQTALTLRPDVPQWNFHLGKIRYELRDFTDARNLFTRSIAQLPTSGEAWRAKAFTEFHLGNQDAMRYAVEQWFALEGATPSNRVQLAYLLQPFSHRESLEWKSLLTFSTGSNSDSAANAWQMLLYQYQKVAMRVESAPKSSDDLAGASWQRQLADDFLLRTEWHAVQTQLDAVKPEAQSPP